MVTGLDLSNDAFPFMAAGPATIAGVPGRLFRISFSGELAYELRRAGARTRRRSGRRCSPPGEPFGIRPYGLDALNTLRIEKGHITGAELNGNTSAADLGFERMLKKDGDFIGRVLAQRPALLGPASGCSWSACGPWTATPAAAQRHAAGGARSARARAWATSPPPRLRLQLEGWVGLALLAGGRARLGDALLGTSPVHGGARGVEIVSPHIVDPENRVSAPEPAASGVRLAARAA